jgi:hypothetical protein
MIIGEKNSFLSRDHLVNYLKILIFTNHGVPITLREYSYILSIIHLTLYTSYLMGDSKSLLWASKAGLGREKTSGLLGGPFRSGETQRVSKLDAEVRKTSAQ